MKTIHVALQAAVRAAVVLGMTASAGLAQASCGSSYCTLMTDRYAQGNAEAHLGWSGDLRLEVIDQKKLRSGTSNIQASEVTHEEAIERHTKNRNLVTTLGYGFDRDWSISLRVPLVHRDHLHDLLDEETGLPGEREQWRFTRLGDVQLIVRRQFASDTGPDSHAVFGGFKLPTGATHVTNGGSSRAERALQPGSGTTDFVVGLAGRHVLDATNAVIGQASVTQAVNSDEGFKPGRRLELSAGWSHAYSHSLGAVLQVNLRRRERDHGAQAEPDNSGSTSLDLSPGVTFGVGGASTLYAYVQVPVYQKVNGIQLVPRASFVVGLTSDF
ncbi:MAG: hypothetical protein QFE16_02495 [Pseudomonadota bacterium]|nr:hypothetical protein [Pseudomonadota bacterium]